MIGNGSQKTSIPDNTTTTKQINKKKEVKTFCSNNDDLCDPSLLKFIFYGFMNGKHSFVHLQHLTTELNGQYCAFRNALH